MHKRQVADRLFMLALIALIVLMSIMGRGTMQYHMAHQSGAPAFLSLIVLTVLAAVALADTVINDMLPDQFRIGVSLYCRQMMWLFMAATLCGYAFVAFKTGFVFWVGVWYMIVAVRCVSIAFLDLHYEIKHAQGSSDA